MVAKIMDGVGFGYRGSLLRLCFSGDAPLKGRIRIKLFAK